MFEKWIATNSTDVFGVVISSIIVYGAIILFCRLNGLRSFSKMSSSDFAMTVAVGSLFASIISSPSPSLLLGLFALGCLFVLQWLISYLRRRSSTASQQLDNQPLLLMRGKEFVEEHLNTANVTRSDIYGKLREANVHNFEQIRAVVFEATGDVSVLHASNSDDAPELEDQILSDVVGWER